MSEPVLTNTNTDALMHKVNMNNKRTHQLMPTPIDFNVNELEVLPNDLTIHSSSHNMSIAASCDEDEDNTVYVKDEEYETDEEDEIQSCVKCTESAM